MNGNAIETEQNTLRKDTLISKYNIRIQRERAIHPLLTKVIILEGINACSGRFAVQ
jgi:hypothetical protein